MAERWRLPDEVIAAIARSAVNSPDPDAAAKRFKARLFNAPEKTFAVIGSDGGFLGIAADRAEAKSRWGSAAAEFVPVEGRAGTGSKSKHHRTSGFASIEEAKKASVRFPGPRRGQRSPVRYQRVTASRVFGADLTRGVRQADEFIARRNAALDLVKGKAHKLVIDTSVVSAGIRNPEGSSGQILEMVMAGKILPVAIRPLADELDVLKPAEGGDLLREYRQHVLLLSLTDTGESVLPRNLVGDPGDLPVVKSALFGDNPPLSVVTRDMKHLMAAGQMLAEKFGIEVFLPEDWLKSFAPAALGLADDAPES